MLDLNKIKIEDLSSTLPHINDDTIRNIKKEWFKTNLKERTRVNTLIEDLSTYLLSSNLNSVIGIDKFVCKDFTYGCTDFIDTFLQKNKDYQIIEREYSYYSLLGKKNTDISDLKENIPVIVSLPNYYYGNRRPDWADFLDICEKRNIDVHIDGAWLTCAKNCDLDLTHPSIKSFAMSITKLGFEWNKAGIRWSRQKSIDSITIRNHHSTWINQNILDCTNFIINNHNIDHSWNTHETNYNKICDILGVERTNFIHVVKQNNKNLGISKLLDQMTISTSLA